MLKRTYNIDDFTIHEGAGDSVIKLNEGGTHKSVRELKFMTKSLNK